MKEYTIRVYNDAEDEPDYEDFRLLAVSEIKARVYAFCLSDGSIQQPDQQTLIELAKTWTEVLTTREDYNDEDS